MRTLYHFKYSPFSRRTRLALVHKGLDAALRECSDPAWRHEARTLVPLRTIPVLVDGARALGDSVAITRWLDAAYPGAPRLWPRADAGDDADDAHLALEVAAHVDHALDAIINTGTRYYPLHGDHAWAGVRDEMIARAQLALDALAQRVAGLDRATIAQSGWSAADMWLLTAVVWLRGLPARVESSPNAKQIMQVGGWSVPPALVSWAEAHASRDDVRAL
jgi:glutathione S-transferase